MADNTSGIPARAAAQEILDLVLRKRRPLDTAIEAVLADGRLEPRDAGFARAIASETLRRFGMLDALIRSFVPKAPPPHRAGPVPDILLAGACELLFLDVPAHAAVDAANRLAMRDSKAKHFKALINAVLRRVSREGKNALSNIDTIRMNVPDWLWTRWCETYGEEVTRAIAAAHLNPPPVDLMMKGAAIAFDNGAFENAKPMAPDMVRLRDPGRIDALPGFSDGAWWVQDFAATLPARLLGDVAGKTVIDLCAAPGGKTAQLAARGAHVIAVEREAERAARLRENLARLKLDATVVETDLRDFTPEREADFVLLDAPCSATGTIRRHPDLPWTKSASDVTACAQTAAELIDAAAAMVAPGGTFVFAVCSLEREEGEEQIAGFLNAHSRFKRACVREDEIFGHRACITKEGYLRTLPCHMAEDGGMDGFFAARLKRI